MDTRRITWVTAALLLLFVAAPVAAGATVVATEGDLLVTNIDVTGYPRIALEFTAPAAVTAGPLTVDDVAVTEAGRTVETTLVAVPTAGLEVVLAVDTSGSMKEQHALGAAVAAALAFLDALPSEVPVGIVAFSDTPRLVSALTTDRTLLARSLAALSASGETALYDAMVLAEQVFSGATTDRQIVLLSDGGNTVGTATPAEALAVSASIRTSVVELTSSEANHATVQQLADAGHGTISAASDPGALRSLFTSIAASLVHRYRAAFDSTSFGTVTYQLTVDTSAGVMTASASARLPAAPTSTTSPPRPTTSSATPTSIASPTDGAASGGSGTSSLVTTTTWLRIGTAACFLALLLGLGALFTSAERDDSAAGGLRSATTGRARAAAVDDAPAGVAGRLEALADRALGQGDGRRGLAMALDVAATKFRPGEFVVLSCIGSVVLALVLSIWMGWWGVVLGAALAPLLGGAWVSHRADRRRAQFDEQLPDTLQLMVSLLRSGYGLPQALDAVANQVAEPTVAEFRRVLFEVRIGRDPTDALTATATRMRSRDFAWVVQAIRINREVGGELAGILEAVGATVRERQRLGRQVQALTAEGRLSAVLLTSLPIGLVVVLSLLNPGYFAPLKESPGIYLVAVAVVLLCVGWVWMRHIVKVRT